jgi:CO/xanthine dehydrogenase Mo-binding subunit
MSLQMVGGRPPFHVKYKIGATKDGTLTSVRMKIYQDQVKL